jgi:capsular polysaccharide export protein
MEKIDHLAGLVGAARVVRSPGDADAAGIDVVLGWGEKPTADAARAWAERHGKPYRRVEDGFLRSVDLGVSGAPPLSVVVDDLGIYYDARGPSRLERLLAGPTDGAPDPLEDPALLARAAHALARIRAARLSKYNDAPPGEVSLGGSRARVLVVDQTAGDLSVELGRAEAATFAAMLEAARREHPAAEIVVKTHPDVLAGKKRGYLEQARGRGVRLYAEPVPPLALLEQVDHVYAVTSQLGFEGLIAGKPVTTFGVPFYAGWGLTDDRGPVERRGRRRTVEQVFAAAYLLYARYVDPADGAPCDAERVIEHLALQRSIFARNQGALFCFGFTPWKRGFVADYLRCPGNQIHFVGGAREAIKAGAKAPGARLVVWGQREPEEIAAAQAATGAPVWRIEDGFLRSIGLGSDFTAPASLVVDRSGGIYYDPSRPSELEQILTEAVFEPDEVARAAALRRAIVASGVSKYNVGRDAPIEVPAGRDVVLVPGQVEDDASILLGCKDVRTNLGLLEAARAARPDAHLLWKPHPDVISGNRKGVVPAEAARALGAQIVEDATLAQCLAVATEVHTMTSLVGFEALLRERPVTVYGQPFYSGWGLTNDRNPHPRRTRRLALDELVAGTYLRYPRYFDPRVGFTTAERVAARLHADRVGGTGDERIARPERPPRPPRIRLPWPLRQLRKLRNVVRNWLTSRRARAV